MSDMQALEKGLKWFNTEFFPIRRRRIGGGKARFYDEGVLPQLRLGKLRLFTPWGPRYTIGQRGSIIQLPDPEVKTLNELRTMYRELKDNMPGFEIEWIILGADLYGTNNGLDQGAVAEYFDCIKKLSIEMLPGSSFKLWSVLAAQPTAQRYRKWVSEHWQGMLSVSTLQRAKTTAQKRGLGSADGYLIERLTEAFTIDCLYSPIKVSLAPPHKDEEVDGPLPRLYIIPPELQTPWLK